MPCASVSANRIRTSVENEKPSTAATLRSGRVGRRACRPDPRAPAVCRADRRGSEHGVRDSRTSAPRRGSGPTSIPSRSPPSRRSGGIPPASGASTASGSICFAPPSRTRRTWRSPSSSGVGSFGPSSPRTSTRCTRAREARTSSRCTDRSARPSASAACGSSPRRQSSSSSRTSAVPPCPRCGETLKPGVVLFGELLPAGAMERATQLAREAAARARGRIVARGLARRRSPARSARVSRS